MENKINIDFNNADLVLEQFNKAEQNDDQKVLRLIPVSNFNEHAKNLWLQEIWAKKVRPNW